MKILLPAAALLLGGAALLARGETAHRPPAPKPLRTSEAKAETPAPVPATASAASESEMVKAAVTPSTSAVGIPKLGANAGFVGFLKAELALSDEQARGIAGILEDRAREVSGYEAEVHERGWFRMEDFNHRVDGLREGSYRRIAALLDADQARAFAALWPVQLLAKDCIVVALPEEKVVTLD